MDKTGYSIRFSALPACRDSAGTEYRQQIPRWEEMRLCYRPFGKGGLKLVWEQKYVLIQSFRISFRISGLAEDTMKRNHHACGALLRALTAEQNPSGFPALQGWGQEEPEPGAKLRARRSAAAPALHGQRRWQPASICSGLETAHRLLLPSAGDRASAAPRLLFASFPSPRMGLTSTREIFLREGLCRFRVGVMWPSIFHLFEELTLL